VAICVLVAAAFAVFMPSGRPTTREPARLFQEQGYDATTVVLLDDYDPLMARLITERPADEPAAAAVRGAILAADRVHALGARDPGEEVRAGHDDAGPVLLGPGTSRGVRPSVAFQPTHDRPAARNMGA
jgi:hypothetical protein